MYELGDRKKTSKLKAFFWDSRTIKVPQRGTKISHLLNQTYTCDLKVFD